MSESVIIETVRRFFECGRNKDFAGMRETQLSDSRFSSFSDLPPYDLKDYNTSMALEELRFVSISDYTYELGRPKVSIFGDTAVLALELTQQGMLVDNKAFTGRSLVVKGRATFVLARQDASWKIVHMHLSKISG